MRIAFLVRYDFYEKFGGDTNQIEKYKKYWVSEGANVDIITTKKFKKDYDAYIVVNIDRFLETFHFLKELKKNNLLGKTFFLTIHHSYHDIEYFEKKSRKGINGFITGEFGFFGREKIKSIVLGWRKKEYFIWSLYLFFLSEKKFIYEIKDDIKFIFIAMGEKDVFEKDYNLKVINYIMTKNGCDIDNFSMEIEKERDIDILISGRIEQRKNTVSIANELSVFKDKKIVFVGGENKNDPSYYEIFKKIVSKNKNIEFLGKVDSQEMKSLYLKSKVHISASWFEVSSLVDLEAYYYGCNIISSTNGHTREFLGESAVYIDPRNISLLCDKVKRISDIVPDIQAREEFIQKYHSWESNSKILLSDLKKCLKV